MATNHTTNYHLNTWEPGDSFLRSEFNENFNKLDTALKAEADARTAADAQKAEAAALTALTQVVNTKGNCHLITGTYKGTGVYGLDKPTVIDLSALGRTPLAVFVGPKGQDTVITLLRDVNYAFTYGFNATPTYVTWTDTEVKMSNKNTANSQFNDTAFVYFYAAIG